MRILSRSQWGADNSLPRRGYRIGRARRTEVFIHHTDVADRDATPNEWDDLASVRARMLVRQIARPDLGKDVPYNYVAFCMRNGELVLCEGRGLDRTAAHAKHHNRSGLGISFEGNFESHRAPSSIDNCLEQLTRWLQELREEKGFVNLGNSRPKGKQVWGHRDGPRASTRCPGRYLYPLLEQIRFIREDEEDAMDKPTWKLVQRALQAQDPPLYEGKRVDGLPGRNTSIAVSAFERRVGLEVRGVVGEANDPGAAIWPATRELLFATAGARLAE